MNLRHRLIIDYQYQTVSIDIDYHRLSIPSIGYPGSVESRESEEQSSRHYNRPMETNSKVYLQNMVAIALIHDVRHLYARV